MIINRCPVQDVVGDSGMFAKEPNSGDRHERRQDDQ